MRARWLGIAAAILLAACRTDTGETGGGEASAPSPETPVEVAGSGSATASCQLVGTYGDNVKVFRSAGGMVSFRADVDVNTDGALESYRIDDLGNFDGGRLNTRSALNTICNGVNIRSASNQVVFSASQCSKLIPEFERIRDFGWLKEGENYVEFYAIARVPGTDAAGKSKGKPCEKDGFYVSQTARPIDSSKGVCDPARWVDALRIPAIVLPLDDRMAAAGVRHHDVAAVRATGGNTWHGAIVGDTNPSKIGEGTVLLAMQLRGQSTIPANYRETVRLKLDEADYVVFPSTASSLPRLSNGDAVRIDAKAQALLAANGVMGSTAICH
jgi:hypothetical protein